MRVKGPIDEKGRVEYCICHWLLCKIGGGCTMPTRILRGLLGSHPFRRVADTVSKPRIRNGLFARKQTSALSVGTVSGRTVTPPKYFGSTGCQRHLYSSF